MQMHLRRVMHKDRFMRRSSIGAAITNRIWRDLIHNPLHLIFSVDVLGMTSSTLASLSKGFAELSTDGQFQQLRSKQVLFLPNPDFSSVIKYVLMPKSDSRIETGMVKKNHGSG